MFGFLKSKAKNKALIIVDVQNDFVPGGALAVPNGDQVVPVINKLLPEFETVVATKDWHPKEHCSFASTHPGSKVGDRVDLDNGSQLVWPDHCVQGTPGAEFVAGLETAKIQKTFQKGVDASIDSYSGMYDNGFVRETGLRAFLQGKGIQEVHIVGLATDYTVKYTALDCKKVGFDTYVIRDACRAVNLHPGDEEKSIKELQLAGVHVK